MSMELAKAIWQAKMTPRQPAPSVIVPEPAYEPWTPPPIAPQPARNELRHLNRTVAQYYGIPFAVFVGPTQKWKVAHPRQVAMYLASTILHRSLNEIGRPLGNRDHTTILWGVRKIARLLGEDENLARQIEEIKQILQGE